MDEPKTRREKKGRDKTNTNTVYSAKHVRGQERMQAKKQEKQQAVGEKTKLGEKKL